MAEEKGWEKKTIQAFVMRRPFRSGSSPLAVTLVKPAVCLTSDGFHAPLATWDGRFLNIPAPPRMKRSHAWSKAYETGSDIARLLLRRVVTHVHGTAQWEAIEPVAPVFSKGRRMTWAAKNGEPLIRLPYPFVFDVKHLVIVAPDMQTAFLRSRRHQEAYLRVLKTLGGTIAETRREEIARKVFVVRTRSERERGKTITEES